MAKQEPKSCTILFILSTVIFLGAIAWMGWHGPIGKEGHAFIWVYLAAFAGFLGIWRFWIFKQHSAKTLIALAVVSRALMLPFPESDDVNRYVWEGRIQTYGYSPYQYAPDSKEFQLLRDDVWEGINHKHISAIYPPLAQLVFRIAAGIWDHPRFFKIIVLLFELGLIWALFGLVRSFGIDIRHLILYVLNPVVLLYVAGEAHYEPMYLFPLFAAILSWRTQRHGLAFFLLGLASMIKIVPAIFLPFFVTEKNWRTALLFLIPLGLAIPYADGLVEFLSVVTHFSTRFYYNGLVFSTLDAILPQEAASLLCLGLLGCVGLVIFFFTPNPFRASFVMAGALLLCAPTFHQWYLLLVIPFLPFFRSIPWLVLCGTIAATFATRILQFHTGGWEDYAWARYLEYGPFLIAGVLGIWKSCTSAPTHFNSVRSVSIIIPTLNEAGTIIGCIQSIAEQNADHVEILVVDGGSHDGTPEKATGIHGVQVVPADPGRGNQIREGVQHARGDAVLVLHADARLLPGSIHRMVQFLDTHPQAIGGSFGQVYDIDERKFRFVALLNNLRARLSGISFGDQGQFFRKAHLEGGFPDYALMEDVEASFRMKKSGSVAFLSDGILNSTRRWSDQGYSSNMRKVTRLVSLFMVKRRLGMIHDQCRSFYEEYYARPAMSSG